MTHIKLFESWLNEATPNAGKPSVEWEGSIYDDGKYKSEDILMRDDEGNLVFHSFGADGDEIQATFLPDGTVEHETFDEGEPGKTKWDPKNPQTILDAIKEYFEEDDLEDCDFSGIEEFLSK